MFKSLIIAAAVATSTLMGASAQAVPERVDGVWVLPERTASQPASRPASSGGQYSGGVEQWRPAAAEACGGDVGCTNYVLDVIACESGGDPNAVGPNGELGILQVDPAYWGTMSSEQQIAALLNPPAGMWWVCG